jgi:hypothetical protein
VDKPYCPQAKYTAYGQPFGSGLNHLAKVLSLSNDFLDGLRPAGLREKGSAKALLGKAAPSCLKQACATMIGLSDEPSVSPELPPLCTLR